VKGCKKKKERNEERRGEVQGDSFRYKKGMRKD
jgi:hypothetical protein